MMKLLPTSYLQLPACFYEVIKPKPVTNPYIVKVNSKLADSLGISTNLIKEATPLWAGNQEDGSLPTLALAYAGHQFGHYVPLLGDGRAHVLGEIASQNIRWDVQLKGSGQTQFSRQGDGRAPLSAVLREYLVSEAMHGLGIPTTRSLVVIGAEDNIYRQEGLVPQGVLTRLALSHLRIGSFQFAATQGEVQKLADYAIKRLYPSLISEENRYIAFFKKVIEKQALLIARWLSVGFIHGVMNTDNMSISGETLDYGPCAFLDEFNIQGVFSSIDYSGRYAYGNQPDVAYWNLLQLGQSLIPLFSSNLKEATTKMQESLETFFPLFRCHWYERMQLKLGLTINNTPLIDELMILMHQSKLDFTSTFLRLSQALDEEDVREQMNIQLGSKTWINQWMASTDKEHAKDVMARVNPTYIPRNHLIEKAIKDYLFSQDRTLFDRLLSVFQNPYEEKPNTEELQRGPTTKERIHHTFCGT